MIGRLAAATATLWERAAAVLAPKVELLQAPPPPPSDVAALLALPYFDPAFYAAQLGRDDLDGDGAAQHFLANGDVAGICPHALFDPAYYRRLNPDVAAAGLNSLLHFRSYGRFENRQPHPLFDTAFVQAQLRDQGVDPLERYIETSGRAFQPHPFVDRTFIRAAMPDALATVPELVHLLTHAPEPNPNVGFDSARYRRAYPDIGTTNAARHYVEVGIMQGRTTFHTFLGRDLDEEVGWAARLDPEIATRPPAAAIQTTNYLSVPRGEYDYIAALRGGVAPDAGALVVLAPAIQPSAGGDATSQFLEDLVDAASPRPRIVIVTTDRASDPAAFAMLKARGCTVIDLSHVALDLSTETKARAVAHAVQTLLPIGVVVAESEVGWALLRDFGQPIGVLARPLAFAPPYRPGRPSLAWRHLRDCSHRVEAVLLTDPATPLRALYDGRLPAEAFRICRPYRASLEPGPAFLTADRRRIVLCLGRPHDEAGQSVLADIASRLREVGLELDGDPGFDEAGSSEAAETLAYVAVLLLEPTSAGFARGLADASGWPTIALKLLPGEVGESDPEPSKSPVATQILAQVRACGHAANAFLPARESLGPVSGHGDLAGRLREAGLVGAGSRDG